MKITNVKYDLDTVIELPYSKLYKCLHNSIKIRYELYLLLINLDEFEEINISIDSIEENIRVFLEAMSIHEEFIIREISTEDTHYEFCLN